MSGSLATAGAFRNAAALATGAYVPYITAIYATTTVSVTGTLAGNSASVTISVAAGTWFSGAVFSNITAVSGTGYMFW